MKLKVRNLLLKVLAPKTDSLRMVLTKMKEQNLVNPKKKRPRTPGCF